MSVINNLIQWTKDVFLPHGPLGLFVLSFIESSFFPIPPDILLVVLAIMNPDQALLLATIATVGSTLGGLLGYFIGYTGKKTILDKFVSKEKIGKVHRLFNKHGAWAIFIAGFTPIPYKIFTIAAGVFYIDLKKFIIASFTSRGLRFFAEAILIILFGSQIQSLLENNFDIISLIAGALLIVIFIIYKKIKK